MTAKISMKEQTGLAFYRVAGEVVSLLPEIATKALLALLDAYEKIHDPGWFRKNRK